MGVTNYLLTGMIFQVYDQSLVNGSNSLQWFTLQVLWVIGTFFPENFKFLGVQTPLKFFIIMVAWLWRIQANPKALETKICDSQFQLRLFVSFCLCPNLCILFSGVKDLSWWHWWQQVSFWKNCGTGGMFTSSNDPLSQQWARRADEQSMAYEKTGFEILGNNMTNSFQLI